MVNNLPNGRATVNTFGYQVEIHIPSKKRFFDTIFLSIWVCGWFFGESIALEHLRNDTTDVIIIIWLCGWTLTGCYTILAILWDLTGSETTTAKGDFIQIKKSILGIGFRREYTVSSITNFRIVPVNQSFSLFRSGRINNAFIWGPLVFDYGKKTVTFGLGIDEAEANYILRVLQEKNFVKDVDIKP